MTSRLSHELIQELAPLLGSLARMTARGSDLSKEHLQIVLEGAGLETHAETLTELIRWTRLLDRVRTQPSMQVREAVVEALLLRGLPEATVLLAVDTVADSVQPVQSRSPIRDGDTETSTTASRSQRLIASTKTLDFGVLSVDRNGEVQITVQGGPGHVFVESDHVLVRPIQFGANETRLRVVVKPLAGGMLWTSLKLVTASETLEIPIIAQWDTTSLDSSGGSTPVSEPKADSKTPFDGFNTRQHRSQDMEMPITVTLEEVLHGTKRTLQRENGRRLEVDIPAGVRTGSRVRVSGEGSPGTDGQTGDLYLLVEVAPHSRFCLDKDDLTVEVEVDLYTAQLGGEVQVLTLERPVMLTMPAGTQNGKCFRLRGLGMPNLRNSEQRGDLYAEIKVALPENLSAEEKRLFERLRTLRSR